MSKKRKKRSADDPMTGEEEQLMLRMPSACGLPIVERLTVGTEMQRNLNGRPRPDLKTIRAKLCCQGCICSDTVYLCMHVTGCMV
jgi:hypothetical protein